MGPGPSNSENSEIQLGGWTVSEESARRYLAAVGDAQPAYFNYRLIPPLALSAFALSALLESLDPAPGAVHSLQEVTTVRTVGFGERITGVARLERPRQRGGLEFTTASYVLTNSAGATVQTGKTTVLIPVSGAI
jgi:acyl dehydratase